MGLLSADKVPATREAADHPVLERVGRLPVVPRRDLRRVIGFLSRSDLLDAHEGRLHARRRVERAIDVAAPLRRLRSTHR